MKGLFFRNVLPLVCAVILIVHCGEEKEIQLEPVKDVPLEGLPVGPADPMADPGAVKGGVNNVWGSAYPKSLNYWLDTNTVSAEITGMQFESLIVMHSVKEEPVGILADSWETSSDGMEFKFHIRKEARWSDGKPITAEDFIFYYDTMMNPKNNTAVFRVTLSRFERPVAVDDHTVSIRAKEEHWQNFWDAGSLMALPKHDLEGKNFNNIQEFHVVSGPYELVQNKVNRFVLLKRRGDYWGRVLKYNRGKYNFDYIRYRFIEDRNKALEAFKKGEFDYFPVHTASIWAVKTHPEEVQKGWMARQKIYNRIPRGFQGFAINLRREKFQDVRVRKALAYLLNRSLMNKKLMYEEYVLLNSYFPDLYPGYVNPSVPVIKFDSDQARKLLAEAGYKPNDQGLLEKDGQVLSVRFLQSGSDLRHLNIYLQDLKSVGIEATIDQVSLSTARKRLDDFDFDLYWINWGAGRLKDPKPMWHSTTADPKGSINLPGVRDEKIDELIAKFQTATSPASRDQLLRQMDQRLYEMHPYVLLWQADAHRMLYWNRYGVPQYPLGKYGSDDAVNTYWWVDPEQEALLKKSMKNNEAMKRLPATIEYDGP
ncbi:MAG: ABC transporter substrate-binding protein [Leptospiraceae bacterium]|nr:ABC transporter substrate-binding protein [Leptospiraceae bacterium]MCB1304111.1 ABC transporter substrate-binding protein [Leptospiraceae bacterium]